MQQEVAVTVRATSVRMSTVERLRWTWFWCGLIVGLPLALALLILIGLQGKMALAATWAGALGAAGLGMNFMLLITLPCKVLEGSVNDWVFVTLPMGLGMVLALELCEYGTRASGQAHLLTFLLVLVVAGAVLVRLRMHRRYRCL